LPTHLAIGKNGDPLKVRTAVDIDADRQEPELTKLGFLSLCNNPDGSSVFWGAQTTQKPKRYDHPDANAAASISARLPYIMATSRIAQYLKVLARDQLRSMPPSSCGAWLNRWLNKYVNASKDADQETKAACPFGEAYVKVTEILDRPGIYNVAAWLRPWLPFEELTSALRIVCRVPRLNVHGT
jgi:type VI secretion system protein ImpC